MSTRTVSSYFIDLSRKDQDITRVYWLLHISGPKTLPELRASTNWTTHRLNQALQSLRRKRMVRKGRAIYNQPHPYGAKACGLWEAVTQSELKERANCRFQRAVMG